MIITYYDYLHAYKYDILDEINQFFKTQSLPKCTQGEIDIRINLYL